MCPSTTHTAVWVKFQGLPVGLRASEGVLHGNVQLALPQVCLHCRRHTRGHTRSMSKAPTPHYSWDMTSLYKSCVNKVLSLLDSPKLGSSLKHSSQS